MSSGISLFEAALIGVAQGVFGVILYYAFKKKELKRTPLIEAAANGDIGKVTELILGGASINEQDKTGGTALHYAVLNHQLAMTKHLLASGANGSITTRKGSTPLMLATKMNWTEGIECIKSHSPKPKTK